MFFVDITINRHFIDFNESVDRNVADSYEVELFGKL